MILSNYDAPQARRRYRSHLGDCDRWVPGLTQTERASLGAGFWFSSLSPSVRHDLLRFGRVTRYDHGDTIAARGDPILCWTACVKGAVRLSGVMASRRRMTVAYIAPGEWFYDPPVADDLSWALDAHAHRDTSVLSVKKEDFQKILSEHPDLFSALCRLQTQRMRDLLATLGNTHTLALRPRLARHLLSLEQKYGIPASSAGDETRIGLPLLQEELAELVGSSRQRVNQELKSLQREGFIRAERGAIVLKDRASLAELSGQQK